MAGKKLKILGLHGYRTSGEIMQLQAMILTDETSDIAEYNFINGFHVSKGSPPASITQHFKAPYYQWYEHPADEEDKAKEDTDENRADAARHEEEYSGLETTLKNLEELMEKNPVDGVVCFSQGTVIGALMVALAERKQHPVFSQLKFGMYFSSSKPRLPAEYLELINAEPLKTPSLHVNGTAKDEDVEHTEAFVKLWDPATTAVHTHSEGHKFPTALDDLEIYDHIVAWLKTQKK